VTTCYEHSEVPLGLIKFGIFLDKLNCQLLKDAISWSYLAEDQIFLLCKLP
jgi:hypothetical protein